MAYENPRISLTDSTKDVLVKMAGGNPGALTVMLEMIKLSPQIDPQGTMGGLGGILMLDTFDIYEERIWMLYKDVCQKDMIKTLACIRGCQLGIINEQQLNRFIDDKENAFDTDDLLKKVKEQLKEFGQCEKTIAPD